MNSALRTVGDGGILNMIPDKEYLIYGSVLLGAGQAIEGNNATLKRGNQISSALTANYTAGSTTVEVTDGSLFELGMHVNIATAPGLNNNGGLGLPYITAISGNTITLNTGLSNSQNTGANFVTCTHLVNENTDVDNHRLTGLRKIERLNFDGNKANNNIIVDWRFNRAITGSEFGQFNICILIY